MSADATAQAIAKMLQSKEFAQEVAENPQSALADMDLSDEEREMLAGAASDGIEHIFRPDQEAGDELSDRELEQVAGGVRYRGISSLSKYMNSSSLSSSSQAKLSRAIYSYFGGFQTGESVIIM